MIQVAASCCVVCPSEGSTAHTALPLHQSSSRLLKTILLIIVQVSTASPALLA